MKKNSMIVAIIILATILYMIITKSGDESVFNNEVGDEVSILDSTYKVTMKDESKLVYDGDLLVEVINSEDSYVDKHNYYYENDLLILEEQYRNHEVFLTIHKKYMDEKVVEVKRMIGESVEDIKKTTYDGNMLISTIENWDGIVDQIIISELDNNGNPISKVVKNANDEILYTYKRKYNGSQLIESIEERQGGYKARSSYEYNKNDDLAVQKTTVNGGRTDNYITFYEYEYDSKKRPSKSRIIMLEEIKDE